MLQEIIVEEKLRQFVREHCRSRCSLQLLLFLGRHPYARFSQLAIVHALDARKSDVEKTIPCLLDDGLLVRWTAANDFPFYALTDDELLRDLISGLVSLDWWQCQLMLDQL